MNSYPHEFLAHPQPLMFVAGLLPAQPQSSSTTQANATPSSSRDRSFSTTSAGGFYPRASASNLDPASATAASSIGMSMSSPFTSPGLPSTILPPTSPSEETKAEFLQDQVGSMDERDREFEGLAENLRGALLPMGGKGESWLPDKQLKDFRILLVDKAVRLALRKVAPPATDPPSPSSSTPRSPLSPLTPSSPLYPDGLVAPIWIRKHAELVPSVFVLFLRLYESPLPPAGESEIEREARLKSEKDREKTEDDGLVREIGDRRRRLGERGIKLTVVLMASPVTLDSPALDSRLSYLRRASALSSKASLFVLTPVPADQLPEFVQSLQDALYESAIEYYTAHAKRVRRKRARLPAQLGGAVGSGSAGEKRVLSSQGWAVRYDWKAGWFAEIRGDFDEAKRHYEDCWNELARMFSSTQMLPPRTKRWAEAKVLADCVALRICRILLYQGVGPKVLGPFYVHLKRFGDLSRGWGIGEETFEFWSWIARQYRIFAELLELAIRAGINIPLHPSPSFPTTAPPGTPAEHFASPTSAFNALQVLQPPAYWFITAALCSIKRKRRYEDALELEKDAMSSEAGSVSGYVSTAPGFGNEKKVDHAGLIVELFTRAHTLLKEAEQAQDRLALYVAFKIAETYNESGQHELAMSFFEQISSILRHEQWDPVVKQIRALWYSSAQRAGNVEVAVRLLIEMMCPESGVEGEERVALQEDLSSLLRTTTPAKSEPITIDMSPSHALVDVKAGFWQSPVVTPSSASFQIQMACPDNVEIEDIKFDELRLTFTDDRPKVVISHGDSDAIVDLGLIGGERVEGTAPLRWGKGRCRTVIGRLANLNSSDISISNVVLVLKEGSWTIELIFQPDKLESWYTIHGTVSPIQEISPSVSFISQPHGVKLDVSHHPSAFVDEVLPLTIKAVSTDDRAFTATLSVFLQPGDEGDASTITVDQEESKSLIKDIPLGEIAANSAVEKLVYFKSPHALTKTIDLSLRTSVIDPVAIDAGSVNLPDTPQEETSHTVTIPVHEPFQADSTVGYNERKIESKDQGQAVISTVITCPGPRSVHLESLTMRNLGGDESRLISCSLDAKGFPQEWNRQSSYAVYSKFSLRRNRRHLLSDVESSVPAELLISWRSVDTTDLNETILALPPLALPLQDSLITAQVIPPDTIRLNKRFALCLVLTNAHPSHSTLLTIEIFAAENFVWQGDRICRVDVPPREERRIDMEMIPIGGTGWCALPKVAVWDEREDVREEVRVEFVGKGATGMVFVRP